MPQDHLHRQHCFNRIEQELKLDHTALPDRAAEPDSVTTGYIYDNANRLFILAHSTPTDTLAAYAYLYDSSGNRAAVTETVRLTNTSDLIREAANGFETGTFSAWTSHVNDNAPYLIGTANPNVLPCPGTPSLETHTLPPCWTITVLTIANPNPTPGMASVVSPRTR